MDRSARNQALRDRLKFKNLETKNSFNQRYPHALEILKSKGIDLGRIREKSAKVISASSLAGALFLAPPSLAATLPPPSDVVPKIKTQGEKDIPIKTPRDLLLEKLSQILPQKIRPLSKSEEKNLEVVFQNIIGIKAKATLEGEHLNTSYGLIGAEQHLYRYPGDTLSQHGSGDILQEGIAAGLGGWGYFARSKKELTPSLIEAEKWYAAVQTLYLPDWNLRLKYLANWYKYRKVLIVNTNNGNAVVAAIADAGPAAWTGKSFGGSPEVMNSLGGPKYKKGPVVLFFVDDPENKIPLGPVEYNKLNLSSGSLKLI
jgi:hypothetical protein